MRNKHTETRERCKTLVFTQSPNESEHLNNLVYLSGMSKQDYITCRLFDEDVVAIPLVKVQKHIIEMLKTITLQIEECILERKPLTTEQNELLSVIALMLDDMKGEDNGYKSCDF